MAQASFRDRTLVLGTGQVSASTVAAKLIDVSILRRCLRVTNTGSVTVFIGSTSGVTAATGHAILASGTIVLDYYTGPVYVITGSSTATVTYAEEATS